MINERLETIENNLKTNKCRILEQERNKNNEDIAQIHSNLRELINNNKRSIDIWKKTMDNNERNGTRSKRSLVLDLKILKK